MIKLNTEKFIFMANKKHNFRYDYSKTNYKNSQEKVIIICENNHEFLVRPDMHINRGDGCRLCRNNNMYKNNDCFINELKEIYGDLYIYDFVEYMGVNKKVEIICKRHGFFTKSPNSLIRGRGCNKCSINGKLDTKTFIDKAILVHKNRYDYSNINYVNSRTKVNIICKKHGIFLQLANNHLKGSGCNKCNRSLGELKIENILDERKINYKVEFIFEDLKYKYPLRFDFAILNINNIKFLIEFNGKQHYNYFPVFHKSERDFEESLIRDQLKIDYCKENNIKLYIIKYDDNLEVELEKIIKENE